MGAPLILPLQNLFSPPVGIAPRERKLKYTVFYLSPPYLAESVSETLPLQPGILSFEFYHDWG